jgi:AcrR family transcriptional regulator
MNAMPVAAEARERIVDAAVELAEHRSWEAVRLYEIAAALGVSLDDVRAHFREKEDVADAWFDRADAAMLLAGENLAFGALPARERLHRLIMAWLGALASHRKVTRQMIYGKLEPGHLHIQIPGLMRVSRTVQWIREAAHRDASYARRALEETALTTIYLMTFFYWMRDDSPDSASTSRFLERRLATAERLDHWVFGTRKAQPHPDA